MSAASRTPSSDRLSVARASDGALVLTLSGSWRLSDGIPALEPVTRALAASPAPSRVTIDASGLAAWDTGLLAFLSCVSDAATTHQLLVDASGLPDGARRLLALASAVPERKGARREAALRGPIAALGAAALGLSEDLRESVAFVGDVTLSLGRLALGRARWRRSDFWLTVQQTGAEALPIVSLISFLVGVILAFVGAIQLEQFGASIFVANLVAIGMAREMGAMMTAVIMAGRTGAAFAAQLGTMRVSEEIDALQTMGFPPIDFLVLPRMLALMAMMPLLAIYSNVLGMLGGATIGVFMLKLGPIEYWHQTTHAIRLGDLAAGMIKAVVFGVLVALAGCLRGMQCGRSASAVGQATTSAVVTAIVFIIVSDALLTVIYNVVGL
ncbi:MAG TPA: ABC transporter permease [Myxococcota bacterium]|nr:ABC transporter permease [Myxococcota bacterium]